MAWYDFLSGSDEAGAAAEQSRRQLEAYQQQTGGIYDQYGTQAGGALGEGRRETLGALGRGLTGQLDAYGNAITGLRGVGTGALEDAIRTQQAGVAGADARAAGALAAGQGGVTTMRNLGESYQPGVTAYNAALGLRGPEAAAAARAGFTNTPGWEYETGEATRRMLNLGSRFGGLGGNAAVGLQRDLQARAGQQWTDYMNRLQGFMPLQAEAARGEAQAYGTLGQLGLGAGQLGLSGAGNLASAYGNLFTGQRGLAGDIAGQYGNIASAYGTHAGREAGVQTGWGQDMANVYGNVAGGRAQSARDVVQGNIAANNQVAQAGQQEAANYWGAIGAGIGGIGRAVGGGR